MNKPGFVSGDGCIILINKVGDFIGRLDVPEYFKQYLLAIKDVKFIDFKYSKEEIFLTFRSPINTHNIHFINNENVDCELTDKSIKLSLKSSKKESVVTPEVSKPEPTTNEPEVEDDDKEPEPTKEIGEVEDDNVIELNLTQKLRNVAPGVYKVNFNEDKFQWAMAYTKDNKRVSIKEPGKVWDFKAGIKTITPISNKKK